MKPRVSVVIPVYNSEKSILSCLQSVVEQEFSDWEIIAINDGSSDESAQLIEEFIASHPNRKIHLYTQENQGVSMARNAGMQKASGEFIAFLDSDDIWDRDKLTRQMNEFGKNPEIDLLGANRDGIVHGRYFWLTFERMNKISPKMLMFKNYLMTSSVVFKREVLKSVEPFKKGMSHAEDLEFFFRICKQYNCYLLNESVVYSIDNKPEFGHSGLSADIWSVEKGELYVLQQGFKTNVLSAPEYGVASLYSWAKYMRRVLLTKFRKVS